MNKYLTSTAIMVATAALLSVLAAVAVNPGSSSADDGAGGAPAGSFVPSGTGAVWTRDGNPAGKKLTWEEARGFLRNLTDRRYLGCAGWRLPTREELTAMATYLNSGNAEGEGITPEQDYYWSSSTDSLESDYADAVNMEDGSVDSCDKSEFNYVWPVCGG